MKTILYWMPGCPHCDKIKKEIDKLPNGDDIIQTEKSHLTPQLKKKYEIRVYPTLVFLTDNNKFLSKAEGYLTSDQIAVKLKYCDKLEKMAKRRGEEA
jgi:thioredoxin-related protein